MLWYWLSLLLWWCLLLPSGTSMSTGWVVVLHVVVAGARGRSVRTRRRRGNALVASGRTTSAV
eukprot:765353-Prymnesium_polylepis.2